MNEKTLSNDDVIIIFPYFRESEQHVILRRQCFSFKAGKKFEKMVEDSIQYVKIVFTGELDVGKTSLATRFFFDEFSEYSTVLRKELDEVVRIIEF